MIVRRFKQEKKVRNYLVVEALFVREIIPQSRTRALTVVRCALVAIRTSSSIRH